MEQHAKDPWLHTGYNLWDRLVKQELKLELKLRTPPPTLATREEEGLTLFLCRNSGLPQPPPLATKEVNKIFVKQTWG